MTNSFPFFDDFFDSKKVKTPSVSRDRSHSQRNLCFTRDGRSLCFKIFRNNNGERSESTLPEYAIRFLKTFLTAKKSKLPRRAAFANALMFHKRRAELMFQNFLSSALNFSVELMLQRKKRENSRRTLLKPLLH